MTEKELNEKQKKKKLRILREATRLFSFKGYDDTTVSQIAKASEVSFGSVFTYFETKEALFQAVITEPFNRIREQFSELDNQGEITAEYLNRMVEQHIQFFVRERPYLQLIQQILGNPERFPELLDSLNQISDYVLNAVVGLVKRGQKEQLLDDIDPEIVATGYISFLIGMPMFMTDPRGASIWMKLKPIALKILGL